MQRVCYDIVSGCGVPLETLAFHPHITIARNPAPLPSGALTSIMACINNTPLLKVPVDRVLLMNSRANGPGPRYTIIHQALLKGQTNHG
jgi:2'-5' RNA ligase